MPSDLVRFFNVLFGELMLPTFLIELRAIAPSWHQTDKRVLRYFATSIEDAVCKVHEWSNKPPYNIYYGVLPRTKKVGTKESIAIAETLWVDIDVKDVNSKTNARLLLQQAATNIKQAPTIIVDSANGLHGYWKLSEVTRDIASVEESNKYIAGQCMGDNTHDCTRILRVPNTLNWKEKDNPKICQVLEFNPTSLLGELPLYSAQRQVPHPSPTKKELVSVTFSLQGLSPLWRRYVEVGVAADVRGFYKNPDGSPDRSRLDYAVVCELVKAGYNEDEIYSIFTNPELGISEKTLSKPSRAADSYIKLTIDKAQKRLCIF